VSIQKSEISGWSYQPSAVSDQLNDLFIKGFCPAMAGLKADR